ncbi:hypothetical protein EJB05_56809, partial [Eragrostis curvula]
MARARATATTVTVALALLVAALSAEAGQNCICECMKLCAQAKIPSLQECQDKCREKACVRSCEEACKGKGYPKLPTEGIALCEFEPLTPDEEQMVPH